MPTLPHFVRIERPQSLDARGRAIAIGNFDGVHGGHRAVLKHAMTFAKARSLKSAVLTFDPHPAVVLSGAKNTPLTLLPRKAELIAGEGIDEVIVKTFDTAFAAWKPEQFARELLRDVLDARVVIVGGNFRFGRKREGDLLHLETFGRALGFSVPQFKVVGDAHGIFSSTRIREALVRGDLADANHVLGRWHAFSGVVGRGAQRGRTIGFPTANVEEVEELVPARGVYAVLVDALDSEECASELGRGVMNIGVRPTVDQSERPSHEVHIFDFDRDIYGARVRVHVVERLRDEKKFASLDELRAQIAIDAENARKITASIPPR